MDYNFWDTEQGSGVLAPVSEPAYAPQYISGGGVLKPQSGPSYLDFTELWGTPNVNPDGQNFVDQRANTSWSIFDQSKVSASLFDVMNSGVQAAGKVGVQYASDSINREAKQNSIFGSFARNFRSTKTGQQINAASYATQFQNFLMNPVVWLVAGLGVVALFVMKRG